jgi:hypothetical protein
MSITSNLSEFASDFNSANDGIIIKTSSGIVSVPDNYYSTSSNLSANLLIIQGVNDSQNNIIGSAFSKANSAFDNSNTKFSSSGGTVTGDVTITGNVVVSGTTTTINVDTLTIKDKNIVLANVASPTDVTADGAGLTIKGTTDKTWNWVDSNDSWTSSENLNLLSGKTYKINGTDVLTGSALGSGVTSSSLTSVGTLSSLSVSGNTTLGSSSSNTLTINSTSVSCPNNLNFDSNTLFIDAANNRIGIGANLPLARTTIFDSNTPSSTHIPLLIRGGSAGVGNDGGGIAFATAGSSAITSVSLAATAIRSLNEYASESNGEQGSLAFYTNRRTGTNTYTGLVERFRVDASGNFLVGTNGVNNVYDQVAAARTMIIQSGSSATTLNSSTNALVICNSDTTSNNISQLSFAAITGASTNQYSSATISAIHGVRVNGQYPSGQLVFSTSSATNLAPTEKMRIDSSGNVGIGTNNPSLYGRLAVNGNIVLVGSGLLDFTATTVPTISKSSTNRLDISPIGGPHSSNPFWTGLHLSSPLVTEGGTNRFPRASHYYSYTTETNPTDLTYNILAGNGGGLNHNIYIGTQLGKVDLATNSVVRLSIDNAGIVSINGVAVSRIQTDIMAMWRTADIQGYTAQYPDGGSVSYSWDNGTVRIDTSVGSHNWDIGKVRLPAGSYQILFVYRPSPTQHGWNVYGTNSNAHLIRLQTDAGYGSTQTLVEATAPQINKDLGYSITYASGIYTLSSETTLRIGMQTDPYGSGGYKYFIEAAYILRVR